MGVKVVASTWARDSHDLFDFEASQLQTQTFTVPNSAKFVRSGTDVQMFTDSESPPAGGEPMLRLVQREGCYWVDKVAPASNSSKKLWVVVRDLATSGHKLSESDVIKLGRFKFKVRQMVASESSAVQPELHLDDSAGSTCDIESDHETRLASTSCRICLLEGSSEDDPLIRPCNCRGSIEYVHLGCLRHWVKGRLNIADTPEGSYFYRPLPCELCKAAYPASVTKGEDKMPLVEVPKTKPPFIVLENMMRDAQQHSSRGLHVVSLAENKVLKLGRGHESNVRIADVSISRCHAIIRYQKGSFVLEDHNSKFGTLVAMKKPRPLDHSSAISIQVGRTVLSLSLQSEPPGGPVNSPATTEEETPMRQL
ncbi:MARCHF7 [Symbiodinium necroappetens]|uniref:MARCHF7 protein n=1 Tax=Symbiodinium necroappetens TaxID=1628268 RepID=A0A812MWN7_9DINO|nr:MARCHF7 [Symbiodinium necroappetens]